MKNPKNMGLGFVIAGLVFLCNPIISLVDILPDCMGLLLILVGLNKVADLSSELSEAADGLQNMLRISLCELLAAFLIHGPLSGLEEQMNAREIPTLILVVGFASLFFKCWFLLPALKRLFRGLGRLSEVHKGSFGALDGLSAFTSFFIVLSGAMAVLPYCTVLTSFYGENQGFTFDWYPFLGLFNTFCGLLAALFGLIWLIRVLLLGRRMLRDKLFLESLAEQYDREVGGETGMLLVRRCRLALRLMHWGCLFLLNIRLSYRTILPGIAGAGLILFAVFLIAAFLPNKKKLTVASILLSVVSLLQLFFSDRFLETFAPPDAAHLPRAFNQYLPVQLLRTLEALAFALLLFFLVGAIRTVIREHTGVEYERGSGAEVLTKRAQSGLHKSLSRRLTWILVLLELSLTLSAADAWIGVYIEPFWWSSVLVGAVGLILFSGFLHDLCDEIGYRYHSDGVNKRIR